jgi:ribosomal protein L35AE/L33A
VTSDTLDEENEDFRVNLSGAVNATIADGEGVGTITDDDDPPTISIDDATVIEPNSSTINAIFTVSLSKASGRQVAVQYATADGSATAPTEYTALPLSTLTFSPGQMTRTITVVVNGDALDEANENYFVDLSNATNATIADSRGEGTISDDDPLPTVSVGDATVTEGNSGTVSATFNVTLNAPSGRGLSVNYATTPGSAATPGDYASTSGTLDFTAGQTAKTVTVTVNGDALDEADAETYNLNLSSPLNATIGDGSGLGTITDDDALPFLAIDDVIVTEGDTGTIAATFTVSLSPVSGRPVTVQFASANGSAAAPADYAAVNGTLSFAAGDTQKTITVQVNGETLDEANETFTINLTNPGFATIADPVGLGTIADDDGLPSMSIGDATVTEGNGGPVNANFTVTLSSGSGQPVHVDYATADGDAIAGADYTAKAATLTIPTGQTTGTITVSVTGDALDEVDEKFTVRLTNAVAASLGDDLALGTITDNDPLPTLNVNDVTVAEGDAGTVDAVFTVTLDDPSGRGVSVDYATTDGDAMAPADYATTSGTLIFPAGETTRTVTVPVKGDVLDEVNEAYSLVLTNASNATIDEDTGAGTITDNDAPAALSIGDATVTEGNAGTVDATFTVSLSPVSGRPVTVNYATAGTGANSATAPGDYTATNGTLNFAAGETTKTISVAVNGDLFNEANETFAVNLSNAVGATVADPQGVGTITDDDAIPSLSINDVTVTEGHAGTVAANFTVSLSAASGREVRVNYATANDTAVSPGDYAARSGSLTFTAGQTSQPVTITVNGDLLNEVNETYSVNLTSPTNATIAGLGRGTGTIIDDDAQPALSINNITVVEGNSGFVNATFAVTLSAASGQQVSVGWSTAPDTATTDVDYTSNGGNLVFAPGTTSRPITVQVRGDFADELDENFVVNLADPVHAGIADGEGIGTIIDDDGTPTMFIDDVAIAEGNSGTVDAAFTVRLNAPSGLPVTVDFATANGAAAEPGDYAARTGELTFEPGERTKPVTVVVNGDLLNEPNETFFVDLSGETNATIVDPRGLGTINNDDAVPTLSVNDVVAPEGNSGTSNVTMTVALSAPSGQQVTVAYATANGSATAPGDYDAAVGTLSFAGGETTRTISVPVHGDAAFELDETFLVNLSGAVNGSLVDAQGVGTIANDDPAPLPPPAPPPPPPPAPDKTAPGEIINVRVVNGDGTVAVTWTNPSDADLQRVSAVRVKAGAAAQNVPVYEGRGRTFTDRGLKNGLPYRYRIRTYDGAGNVSAGIEVAALPKAALFGPTRGATVTSPPTLRWKAVPGATYYNVQLYLVRRGKAVKVLSAWPKGTSYKLSRTWRFGGKRYRLAAGSYRWYVWPGLAKRSAKKYGPMLGDSSFKVKAAKAKRTRRR